MPSSDIECFCAFIILKDRSLSNYGMQYNLNHNKIEKIMKIIILF
ncbi:MAG: hypothetical protein YK1309IOTA_530001 [Marine Group I thaumarchaeote]|nr:MAG: hypothetical protein YK1309IOTA_530001 [Marine Group I thaumarchaeote]